MIMTHDRAKQSVTINMEKYISDCIITFEQEEKEYTIKPAITPANTYSFKTRSNGVDKLSMKRANLFHSTIAKLLFVAKRERPDILLAVSFLTTRVKNPDVDDWKKLLRLLGYSKNTVQLFLTLSCKTLTDLTWYIDGSYAIHDEM
jgi:hypothetical protein